MSTKTDLENDLASLKAKLPKYQSRVERELDNLIIRGTRLTETLDATRTHTEEEFIHQSVVNDVRSHFISLTDNTDSYTKAHIALQKLQTKIEMLEAVLAMIDEQG